MSLQIGFILKNFTTNPQVILALSCHVQSSGEPKYLNSGKFLPEYHSDKIQTVKSVLHPPPQII